MRHITTAVVGTIVAGYGTPAAASLIARYLGVRDIPVAFMEGMVGFVLGPIGMSPCEAPMRCARLWRDGPPPALAPSASRDRRGIRERRLRSPLSHGRPLLVRAPAGG